MILVGEPIDHRHTRMRGKLFDDGLLEGADHNDIDHACDDARDILDRFAARQLRIAGRQIDHGAAHLQHAGFERDAGTRRVLLENHRQRAVVQR